jgi:hypothetical protein
MSSLSVVQCALDDEVLRLSTIRNVSLPLSSHLRHLNLSYNTLSDKGTYTTASL